VPYFDRNQYLRQKRIDKLSAWSHNLTAQVESLMAEIERLRYEKSEVDALAMILEMGWEKSAHTAT